MAPSFFATRGVQTVTAVRGGGAANARLELHRGTAPHIRIALLDGSKRPFNPLRPDRYYADKSLVPDRDAGIVHDVFEFWLTTAGFASEAEPRFLSADSGPPLLLGRMYLTDNGKDVSDETAAKYDDGILEFSAPPSALFDVEPGHYDLVVRMIGRRHKPPLAEPDGYPNLPPESGEDFNNQSYAVDVADELLGGAPDFSPGIPAYVGPGILPPPVPSIEKSFFKEKYWLEPYGQAGLVRYTTGPIPVASDRNRQSSIHTLALYMSDNFCGTVYANASLEIDPKGDADWFPLEAFEGKSEMEFDFGGDGAAICTEAFHFRAPVRHMRFWFKPDAVSRRAPAGQKEAISGYCEKIMLRS